MDSRGTLLDSVQLVIPLAIGIGGQIVRSEVGSVSGLWRSVGAGRVIGLLPFCAVPDAPWKVLDNILRRPIALSSTRRTDAMYEERDESKERGKEEDYDKCYDWPWR